MPFDSKDNTLTETKSFEEAQMQSFKFIDLSIKIGKVYLYRHNESCDHMIIFNDLRYPYILSS